MQREPDFTRPLQPSYTGSAETCFYIYMTAEQEKRSVER